VLAGLCAVASLIAAPADASVRRHHWFHRPHWHHAQASRPVFRLTEPEKDAALIVDGETGKVLYARNADALRHPASLTKMMTLYLLFEQLKSGQMTLATPLHVSGHASVQAPTKLYLRPGSTISVDDAIKAIVVLSANDVAVTIAENIGGSEGHFAEMMTAKARSWGMAHTFYHNASGLPDPLQITSAGDLSILARHLAYDFPQYFHYFSTYAFTYRGVTHFTHDNLIGRYQGADGIKTGYTNASGFNLVSSVVRNGVHIIGIVMGGTTARRRDSEMMHLLDDTFAAIGKNPLLVAREDVPWEALSQNGGTKPVIAGFPFGTSTASPAPILKTAPQPLEVTLAAGEDEDAAESRPDPAYEALTVHAPPPRPQPQQQQAQRAAAHPATAPVVTASLAPASLPVIAPPAPYGAPAAAGPSVLRGVPVPQPKPLISTAMPDLSAGFEAAADSGKWSIQIGAFDDALSAQAELASYAARSGDVLGQVPRIVAPFHATEGHTLYRARFGPFPESQARHVCQVLTERGQTCFATLAAR
jgi:D-alanyl-D-alanine carboxypeptidase